MKMKALLLFTMVFSLCLTSLAQTRWINQGETVPGAKSYQDFRFQGIISGLDTLWTNAIVPDDISDTTFVLKMKVSQTNDSTRITIFKQFFGASGYVTNHIVGVDSVSTEKVWTDTIKAHSVPFKYALVGTSVSGGKRNGFNTSVQGRVVFIKR